MAEDFVLPHNVSKEEKYQLVLQQIKAVCDGEKNAIANLANAIAILKYSFNWFWVGIYKVDFEQNNLVLNVFQGPLACTRIHFGKGVCGASWKNNQTIIVPNVDEFPGHIACSSQSKSEIVVPIKDVHNQVLAVLDVDSEFLNTFDQVDANYLELLALELCKYL